MTIAPDYPFNPDIRERPGYSESEYQTNPYDLGYVSGTMKGIWNHMRAVDLLQTLPEVDPSRIGCIGHSLGGHNTLFLGAFDERIKASESSCGFTSWARYNEGDLSGWSEPRYMPRIASEHSSRAENMPFEISDCIAAFAPRAFFASAPLHDMFDPVGVQESFAITKLTYDRLGASDNLQAIYPDCGHDFPKEAQEAAYEWLDSRL